VGSDQWFEYTLDANTKKYADFIDALKTTVELYNHVHQYVVLKPAERKTKKFIQSLQKRNIPVIALTTRNRTITEYTLTQLHTIVDFILTAPTKNSFAISEKHSAFYKNGIAFCD
jgi:FMN phosphatase YigB (HAD superfamily)